MTGDSSEYADDPRPLGLVPMQGRGALPLALLNGESLVACATWALAETGAELFDWTLSWEVLRETGRPLVLHDPLCPLTPGDFLADLARRAVAEDRVLVAVLPVTDTLKQLRAGDEGEPPVVGDTVDRDALWQVTSPVVLPARVVAHLPEVPEGDFVELLRAVRERGEEPVLVPAPELSRRVADAEDVVVLEALAVSA